MSDDEKKSIRLYANHIEMKVLAHNGRQQVTCTLVGDLGIDVDWDVIRHKINEGWEVYESGSILQDAIAVLQADLESEKLRYQDLEREKATVIAQFEQKLSLQGAELERLRKMERDLEQLSGLGVHKMVR